MIGERNLHLNRFVHAGIGKMIGHVFPIRFVREPLPDLRQIVLTSGIVDVRSQFRALAHQMTPPPQ